MSKVYIEGFKMPDCCYNCRFYNVEFCVGHGMDVEVCKAVENNLIIMCDSREDKMDWCPLREVE